MPRNDLRGGMVRDSINGLAPPGTYAFALNATPSTGSRSNFGLAAEASTRKVVELPGDILGTTYIEHLQSTVIFVLEEENVSSLYLFSHLREELTFVCSDQEFGCNFGFSREEKMYAEVKTHGLCNDTLIYFSAGCTYYVVNLAEMMSTVRRQRVLSQGNCNHFTCFDEVNMPVLRAHRAPQITGSAPAGSIAFFVRLEDSEGNYTNWSAPSNVVNLLSEKNAPGEIATSGARLLMEGLDPRYSRFTVAVGIKSAGNTTFEQFPPQGYGQGKAVFVYYGQRGEQMNVASLTTPFKAFLRGQDLLQHDGRMFYYNIRNQGILNYYRKAQDIEIGYGVYELDASLQERLQLPSLPRNEALDFGIIWNFSDGTTSDVFHIPASEQSSQVLPSPITIDFENQVYYEGGSSKPKPFEVESVTPPEPEVVPEPDTDNVGEDAPESILDAIRFIKDRNLKPAPAAPRPRLVIEQKGGRRLRGNLGSLRGSRAFRNDPWHKQENSYGSSYIDEVKEGRFGVKYSSIDYPDTVDCNGQRIYPEGKISHFQMPSVQEEPHFVSDMEGVVSPLQPDNYEYGKATIRLLGLKVANITYPTEDELPKPLDENKPYTIVYVPRDDSNSSVIAAGYTTGMFQGEVWGDKWLFPRHGVNSFETVDRSIAAGKDGTSRMGSPYDGSVYTFHSPDTDLAKPFLDVSRVKFGLNLSGDGWRYGLYSRGITPSDPQNGKRVDQRGTRVANNLNQYTPSPKEETEVKSISYINADSVLNDNTLVGYQGVINRYRESAVVIHTDKGIPGNAQDASFVGDVMIHQAATECNAGYVHLMRDIPDQYGTLESRAYISTGISGLPGTTGVSGIMGDTYIGPYSKRRTSFVSNKVGEFFDVPSEKSDGCRSRAVCDTSSERVVELLGLSANGSELPETGDAQNPKNYCGLHTTKSACGPLGVSRTTEQAKEIGRSETDFYYPGTLKSLVHVFCESRVNTWARQTGDRSNGEVYYPGLGPVSLDSAAPDPSPWEDSYLNRFYVPQEQPSRAQLAKLALVKSILYLVVPAATLEAIGSTGNPFELGSTIFAASGANALWVLAVNYFSNTKLKSLFGIKSCYRDSEGGDYETPVEGFSDNYNKYNWDYSSLVGVDDRRYYAPPYLSNLCGCSGCNKGTVDGIGRGLNQEIYYSAKQNLDSEIDAYLNVRVSQYNELPAHAGLLRRLFLQAGNMYAHTTRGIWTLQFGAGNLPTDIGSQLTGDGQLLSRPMMLLESGVSEGFAGTNYPNAAVNIPAWGYFFIDDVAGKVYRFNGKPEEISRYGMKHWLRKHLPFCNPSTNYDELGVGSYVLSHDPASARIFLTKKDAGASFTMSFTPQGDDGNPKWLSYHSELPDHSFWDRDRQWTVQGRSIYTRDNSSVLQIQGKQEKFVVMPTLIDSQSLKYFNLDRVSLLTDTEAEVFTFDQMAAWSQFKFTGLLPLLPTFTDDVSQRGFALDSYDEIPALYRHEEWDITQIRNAVDLSCRENVIIVDEFLDDPCRWLPEFTAVADSCEQRIRQGYDTGDFGGKWVRIWLEYSGDRPLRFYALDWSADSTPPQKRE